MNFLQNMLINRLLIAALSAVGGVAATEYLPYFDAFCKAVQ